MIPSKKTRHTNQTNTTGNLSLLGLNRYNVAQARNGADRTQSSILEIRHFNNWAKNFCISTAMKYLRDDSGIGNNLNSYNQRNNINNSSFGNFIVMDLCCGKGGDINKWSKFSKDITYMVFTDQAHSSLAECMSRYNVSVSNGSIRFPADFILADMFNKNLKLEEHFLAYNNDIRFDLISSMLALHYAFSAEENAVATFRYISALLKPNGYFLCTFTSKKSLLKLLENKAHYTQETFLKDQETDPHKLPPTVEEDVYRFSFCNPLPLNPWTNEDIPGLEPIQPHKYGRFPFGISYRFKLIEAVDDIIEFIVDEEVITNIAKSVGLEIVKHIPTFEDAEKEFLMSRPNPYDMSYHNRSFLINNTSNNRNEENFTVKDLKESSRDICTLYETYIFKKITPKGYTFNNKPITNVIQKEAKGRKLSDIVILNPELQKDVRIDMRDKLWKPTISDEF